MMWSLFADKVYPPWRETDIVKAAQCCQYDNVSEANVRSSLPVPHLNSHAIKWRPVLHITKQDRQVLMDIIAALAALVLVLATLTMSVLYVAHELPRWRTGQIGGFEATIAPTTADGASYSGDASTVQAPTLSRVPLILISMVIELTIFVGLGLYLRHEADRLP